MFISHQDKEVIKRILSLLKPYKMKIVGILICIIFSSGISMLLPLVSKYIMDDGLLANNFKVTVVWASIGFFLAVLDQVIGFLEAKYRIYINSVMPYSLTKTAFRHLLKLKIRFFNNANVTEIMNNISLDINNILRILDRGTFYIITSVFRIVGSVAGLLIFINWKLTILVICIIPVRYLLVKQLVKIKKKTYEAYMEAYKSYSYWYGDTLGGIKEIKLWGIDRIIMGQFVKKQRNIIKTNVNMGFMDKLNECSESMLFEIITAVMYIIGAYLILNNSMTVGMLFAFITYSAYIIGPISSILNIGYSFSNIIPSAKRYFEFLDQECESLEVGKNTTHINNESVRGEIKFDNVSFSYNMGEPVLKNINFEIHSGEKVAIIGANGSGKSTLINLLLRLYRQDEGDILLDGLNINEIHLRDYRQLISAVSQEVYLFDSSIKENIAMYSAMSELKLYSAARQSMACEFIEKMPEKYDSRTGRNGANLSGGERQKIAMARAFAKKPKILLLDEATSNYDIESELQLNKLLDTGLNGITVIIVTHKPQLLKKVDNIVLMENGCIADMGTHTDLYNKNTTYREMIKMYEEKQKDVV